MVVVDCSLAADFGIAAAIIKAAAIAAAVVVGYDAILHIQNAASENFDAVFIAGSSKVCAFFDRYITVPVVRTGVNTQTGTHILVQSYCCAGRDIALGSEYGTVSGVAAGAERGSGVNRHAVGENAPTAASVIVGDEGRMVGNCYAAVVAAKTAAIFYVAAVGNINLRIAINQNIDWIDSHTVPVAISDRDRGATGNLNITVRHILVFGVIRVNAACAIAVETGNFNLRTVRYIKIALFIEVHTAAACMIGRAVERERSVIKGKIRTVDKVSRTAGMLRRRIGDCVYNDFNVLECHIGIFKIHTKIIQRDSRIDVFSALNRQLANTCESQAVIEGNILTNLNHVTALCVFNRFAERIILHIADFRGKCFCRSRGRRAAGIGTACAALFAAGSRRAAFAAFAFIARSAGLYIIAADRCAGFVTVITGGWVCVARVVSVCIGAGILAVSGIIYYIFNAVIRRSGNGCAVHRRRGSVCCVIFGRECGHGQHGEHHQTGESAGEETVISPFHAKTSSACIQTQRR